MKQNLALTKEEFAKILSDSKISDGGSWSFTQRKFFAGGLEMSLKGEMDTQHSLQELDRWPQRQGHRGMHLRLGQDMSNCYDFGSSKRQ